MLGCPATNCIVILKSSQGKFVEALDDGTVTATKDSINDRAKWHISFLNDNVINLNNKRSGKYIRALESGKIDHLNQHWEDGFYWERFKLKHREGDIYALKTHFSKYVSHGSNGELNGNATEVGDYEMFTINVCE